LKTSSAKNKGRRLVLKLREELLKRAPHLKEDDFLITTTSVAGEDLNMSPLARDCYPFSFECKNKEKINIWAAYEQAKTNANGYAPIVCFGRNRSVPMVALSLEDFLNIITKSNLEMDKK
jgi:hypothetical protein